MNWIFIFKNRFNTYENKKLIMEIRKQKLGKEFLIVDPNYLTVLIENKVRFFYRGKEIFPPKKVLVKVGCSLNEHIKDILSTLEMMDVKVINKLEQLEISTNKFLLANKLREYNIPHIKSLKMTGYNDYDLEFVKREFNYPVIVKSKIGSLGKGVHRVNNQVELKNVLELINLLDIDYEYLIQEYIVQGNIDYRVVVYKGEIKYVLRRAAKKGEFKTNYNLGNEVELTDVTKGIKDIVKEIYKAVPLDIMGLDLIKISEDNYKVCEINSNPGFKGRDSLNEESFVGEVIKLIKEY